jgi:O-antigen/teichoic acid export membrane protein
MSAFGLTLCWVAAGAGATFVGLRQLRGSVPLLTAEELVADAASPPSGYRFRPRLERSLSGQLVVVGLANHLLTLCERAPGLVLPIVVTEILSPEATAVWYIVWMSAWVVFTAPISMGIAQFAESARRPQKASATTAAAIKASLIYAGGGAAILAILAPAVLRLLGPEYAQAGTLPLRLLLIGIIPLSVVSAYYAYCRASRRFAEVLVVGTVAGAAAIVVPAVAAPHYGLAGIAIAWVAVQIVVAMFGGIRLWLRRH